jgi:lipid-A-disaccharide synthase
VGSVSAWATGSKYNAIVQILISAGEASGDMYGAQLIEALRRANVGTGLRPVQAERISAPTLAGGGARATLAAPSLQFFGAGGERMRAAGCDIVVDAKDLAVVGITEILSHLPKIYGLFGKLVRAADERQPRLAIVIDSPAFNWRVARQMRKRGIPVVYYVCPQFWAWRQGRVKLLRKYINKALVIFPFEENFYRARGVDTAFVGHPLADVPAPEISRFQYSAQQSLDSAKPWITLMPGSRRKEVRMNLPTILDAAARLGQAYEFVLPVARTLEPSFLKELIGNRDIHLVPEALPALHHSRAAIVASGTATVEAALMATPFVMVYRVSPLTYALGKSRVKVAHYAMVNLIAGEGIVPELVQHEFTAENIVAELHQIIPDGERRARMIQGLASVKAKLKKPDQGGGHPSERAAEVILGMMGPGTSAPSSLPDPQPWN